MYYSKAHQKFSNRLQKPEALTNPEDFLGPNYETVLNFWTFNDSLTEDQWTEVTGRYRALDPAARIAAWDTAWDAARLAAGDAAGNATVNIAGNATRAGAAAGATYELMGMHKLLNDGKTLMFVPLFDFTKEETKEEPPPTGEIFNMRMVRPQYVSTPSRVGVSEWVLQFNSPITHNYYQYSRPIPQE